MEQPFAIETSTIGLTVWNPTNENMDMQYAGISLTLEAGQQQVFEINCAKHLLNSFGPRGLTSLVFGCDDKKKKEIGDAAVKRNHDFKQRMVTEYNQRNASRKQMGLGHLPATQKVMEYAAEIGIKLDDPYSVRDPEQKAVSDLKQENVQLKSQISDLMGKFSELMGELKKKQDAPVEDFVCPKCKRTFGDQEAWDTHVKSHKG